ncbi:fructosamine kinase family protein [Ferrimonas sediminicola]|uniref:Fructosamine kinase family protein n=1 Tax=Ferrimonas sediminicola TaxID=2569538 RepID=A0A4U1BII5_9GAMM|nr:fructosamine kinase family protein [Ferrimonas sediminicola]TKB50369.1 fructosamine kinase family protein [Ferrimonas sediminicola]
MGLCWSAVAKGMAEALNAPVSLSSPQPVCGGDINPAFSVSDGHNLWFVKVNRRSHGALFEEEAEGLIALGTLAPQPLCWGESGGWQYLVLPWMELGRRGDERALGQALAQLHQQPSRDRRYGWQGDNHIGTTVQLNGWSDSWQGFWWRRRLEPQLTWAIEAGAARLRRWQRPLKEASDALLADHQPQPSLLHGDLWRGNAGFDGDRPVIFDPACYQGDREADLAMTRLFGGFSPSFYQGYDSTWPLAQDWQRREALYNLYHQLNHLNLFGEGYLDRVLCGCQEVMRQAERV